MPFGHGGAASGIKQRFRPAREGRAGVAPGMGACDTFLTEPQ